MEARQLLQALRRVRHRSIAAVSTTCQSTVAAQILLLRPLCRLEQGCRLSLALLVTCTSVAVEDYLICAPAPATPRAVKVP
jgi:hypothetical protein